MLILSLSLLFAAPVEPKPLTDWTKARDHALFGKTVRVKLVDVEYTPDGVTVFLKDGKKLRRIGTFAFYPLGSKKTGDFLIDISPVLRTWRSVPSGRTKIELWTSPVLLELDGDPLLLDPNREVPVRYKKAIVELVP